MLSLHNLKPNKKATKVRKRIGRGNASGTGTYSGKGLKGQKSRSGVSGLKRMGLKSMLFSTPKKRGFNSDKPKNLVVNLDQINEKYKDGEVVDPETLVEKGLLKLKRGVKIKVLGRGKLEKKDIKFKGVKVSKSVSEVGKK